MSAKTFKTECSDCGYAITLHKGTGENPWGVSDGLMLWECPICGYPDSDYPPTN